MPKDILQDMYEIRTLFRLFWILEPNSITDPPLSAHVTLTAASERSEVFSLPRSIARTRETSRKQTRKRTLDSQWLREFRETLGSLRLGSPPKLSSLNPMGALPGGALSSVLDFPTLYSQLLCDHPVRGCMHSVDKQRQAKSFVSCCPSLLILPLKQIAETSRAPVITMSSQDRVLSNLILQPAAQGCIIVLGYGL